MNHFTRSFIQIFSLSCLILLLASCGKQKFATNKYQQNANTAAVFNKTTVDPSQSKFTYVKPPVDFLILIDNSGSFNYVDQSIKDYLASLLESISKEFDYQILIAPLIDTGANSYWVIDYDSSNLQFIPNSRLIPLSEAKNKLSSFPPGGGAEAGLDRTKFLLSSFYYNKVFRDGAHHMVTLISNGDQYSDPNLNTPTPYDLTFANIKYGEIKGVVNTILHSLQFRFFTIVPHGMFCGPQGGKPTHGIYRAVSNYFYNDVPSTFTTVSTNNDSFNLCDPAQFGQVFSSINQTIKAQLLRHTYDYWPIVLTTDSNYFNANDLDPTKITVKKVFPNGTEQIIPNSSTNGYLVVSGLQTNFEIRESVNGVSNRGEPYTGFFIQLYGTAKATYPEYFKITTESKKHYYGYVMLDNKPEVSSISLTIDGNTISQSTTNGWEFMGDTPETKNIRIKSPTDFSPDFPEVKKTGWFLKLSGSAIYSNSSSIQINYFPRN